MRLSKYLCKTLKDAPKDAQGIAYRLLLRAGYIRQVSSGVFAYMPFFLRIINKISDIVKDGMKAAGCEEILLPALQSKELWVESDRWEGSANSDETLFVFKDKRGSTLCLGNSYLEVVMDIVRRQLNSYKQLPQRVFQISEKFLNEPRPRFGLQIAKEFIVKDAYSFDIDEEALGSSYELMLNAYQTIGRRIGFTFRCVEAGAGNVEGGESHKFVVLADSGDDTIVFCDTCEYAATQREGESRLEECAQDKEQRPMEPVYGPGLIGVEPLAEFLQIPVWKTTKTLLFQADEKIVAVMVRGDCDVNEYKVKKILKCHELALASVQVIKELTGADVGYAGPVGLPAEITVIADHFTDKRVNFECGANRTDYHNINVNYNRDLPMPLFGDFKLAKENDRCPRCEKGRLKQANGIEIGHATKIGTKYSEKMNCTYLDKDGKSHFAVMGYYGMGISRMASAVVEQNHDESGIIWPASIAPFSVHLVALNLEDEEIKNEAEKIYQELIKENIDVVYDDRDLRAGEKFGDADLLGIPVRLTISKRTCKENKIEYKHRIKDKAELLIFEEALKKIKEVT